MDPDKRDRSRGSTTSVKRRRGASESSSSGSDMEVEQETPGTVYQLREILEDYLFKETNKANKTCMNFVLRLWRQMERFVQIIFWKKSKQLLRTRF